MTEHVILNAKVAGRFDKPMADRLVHFLRPFDLLDDVLFVIDPEGRVAYWNRAAEAFYRLPASTVLARPLKDFLQIQGPDDAIELPWERAGSTAILGRTAIHQRSDRSLRQVEWSARPIDIPECGFSGFLCTVKPQIADGLKSLPAGVAPDRNESRDRFRELADLLPEIVHETDANGRLVYLNRKGLEVTGYTREDLEIGLSAYDLLAPEDHARVRRNMELMLAGKTPDPSEYTAIRKDGTRLTVLARSAPILQDGRTEGFRGFFFDISDRLKTEAALRESEERYRLLAEHATDVVWTMSFDGKFTYVSPSVKAMTGYTPEEVLAIPLIEYVTPETAMEMIRLISEQLQLPTDQRLPGLKREFQQYTKDGAIIDIEVNATWLMNARGEPVGVQGITRDISDRKRAEQALRENEVKFRQMSDSSLTGIFIHQNGRLVYLNPRIGEILGYTPEEIQKKIGESFFPFIHSEDREFVIQRAHKRLAGQHPIDHYEVRMVRKNGETVWTEILVSLIYHQGVPAIMGHVIDISARKRVERDKTLLEDQLRQAQKMEAVGRLAGGVAHDFNNILTGITGYSEMIISRLNKDDPLRADVDEIRRAAERASGLTNQLLAFSRKQIIAPRVIQLNELLSHSQKMLARIIGEDIDLYFAPERDLWNIKADPGQIDQVLINLAVNARDAMPDGGRLLIQTRNISSIPGPDPSGKADLPGDFVRLSVSDNGQGMDEQTQRHIFEPFFSTKKNEQATGLGLATVYGIVNQNKGMIEVQSKVGIGTTFHIYLPRTEEAAEEIKTPSPMTMPRGKETILLVEDEAMVRGLACKVLRLNGYHVLEADSGGDAFLQSKQFPGKIHLLLTDVVMPKMNGRELYEQLKVDRPEMKVLFMSGYTEDVIAPRGVLEGNTQFIQKPFSIDALSLKVREVLDI